MNIESLEHSLYFLLAAVIAVPIFRRLELGAILGYLIAGIVIGPQALKLIDDPVSVLHFAELGVIFLLFILGLELNPKKVWQMRTDITLIGGAQIMITALAIMMLLILFTSLSFNQCLIIGLAVALSSTAFAVQLMAEKGVIATPAGRKGFAILLMQDLAVIPILLFVKFIAVSQTVESQPPWWHGLSLVLALLLAGKYIVPALLTLVAKYGSRDTMTATALLIVVGASYLMELAHLSMAMGAFIAGIMLANSDFRHQLEVDLEPFKGLTLGLFFIAIGMTLDVQLLLAQPWLIIGAASAIILVKLVVIYSVLAPTNEGKGNKVIVASMLAQGGEFAFVIMSQTVGLAILPDDVANTVTLAVGLSMALTTPVVILMQYLTSKKRPVNTQNSDIENEEPEVIIIGFGRYGQVSGRLLSARNIHFTAIDIDPDHIQFVKKFGNKVYFGDGERSDLLIQAGLEQAKVVVIAIDDIAKTSKIVTYIKEHFADITVVVRARNRHEYIKLTNLGADKVIREAFSGSSEIALNTLTALGYSYSAAISHVDVFKAHDEAMLQQSIAHGNDWDKLIEISQKGRNELESLFKEDRQI